MNSETLVGWATEKFDWTKSKRNAIPSNLYVGLASGASHALAEIDRLMRAVSPELFHKRTTELKSIAASS